MVGQRQADRHLAIVPLAELTAILARHPDRVTTFLRRLLSASGVMEARGGGFGYDDGSRRSAVAGEHEGFLSSWPQWTRSTSYPCSTTRSASPWCASTAGQRASVVLDAAATRWSGTGLTTRSRIGSGIAARRARRASTTSAGQCWPGTTSRCGSGCCAFTSWV